MGIFEAIKKGFSVAKSSSSLILVLFAFSFIWNLINIPFQAPAAGTEISFALLALGILFIAVSIFMQAHMLEHAD